MNLAEILADSETFTDDMEMQLGEHKVKLADLRGLTSRQQKELSEKLQAATEQQREALDMSEKATGIYNNLKKLEEESAARRSSEDADDFDTNNWWTPVRKRMTAQEKQVQEAMKKVDDLTASFTKAATMFVTERWNNQYERVAPRLKKSKEYGGWDMPKVRDFAAKNQIVDEFGFPSIERAVAQLTRADDIEEAKRQAREEGLKEGLQRARLQTQARPTSATGAKPQKGKSAVEELGLEGLGDDVMSDDELMSQLEEAQRAFDPNSLQ